MAFFELRTPQDMLEKARREHHRLCERFDIDNVFNYFVTAHHIRDYVRKTNAVTPAVLDAFLQDQDIRDCRDLCDKGKHLLLTQRKDPRTDIVSGCFSGSAFSELGFSAGEEWRIMADGRVIEIKNLADRVMQKWDSFFSANDL